MAERWRRVGRSGLVVLAVAVPASVVISGLGSAGSASSQLDLGPGTAWFASRSTGRVSIIDGPTATRVEIVEDVAEPGSELEVVQTGDNAFAFDRTQGVLRRIDSSTFTAGVQIPVGARGDPPLEVDANDPALWVTDHRKSILQQYDVVTGAPVGSTQPFPGTATSTAMTPDGALWVLDGQSGLLRSYLDDRVRVDRTLALSSGAKLVVVGLRP